MYSVKNDRKKMHSTHALLAGDTPPAWASEISFITLTLISAPDGYRPNFTMTIIYYRLNICSF